MPVDLGELRDAAAILDTHDDRYPARAVRAAIAELSANRAAEVGVNVGVGWQPISTAPKDGTHVLLWAPDYADRPGIGAWCKAVAAWDADIGMMEDGPAVLPDEANGPTHWKPLDAPSDVGVKVWVNAPQAEPAA